MAVGTCGDCAGPTTKERYTRCLPCLRQAERARRTCPGCRGQKEARAKTCEACFVARRRSEAAPRPCAECGARRTPRATLCGRCYNRQRGQVHVCPSCGGHKRNARARSCIRCYQLSRVGKGRAAHPGLLVRFSAARFRALLEWTGWTPEQLEVETGVGRRTIQSWAYGERKPTRSAFLLVAAALGQQPCAHCNGTVYADPTMPEELIEELTAPPGAVRKSYEPWDVHRREIVTRSRRRRAEQERLA